MYKLLREILFELRVIKKELHIIASNTESKEIDENYFVESLSEKLKTSLNNE